MTGAGVRGVRVLASTPWGQVLGELALMLAWAMNPWTFWGLELDTPELEREALVCALKAEMEDALVDAAGDLHK